MALSHLTIHHESLPSKHSNLASKVKTFLDCLNHLTIVSMTPTLPLPSPRPHIKLEVLRFDGHDPLVMQSYPARVLDRRIQVDWAKDAREGPRVLMSLRVDFGPMD